MTYQPGMAPVKALDHPEKFRENLDQLLIARLERQDLREGLCLRGFLPVITGEQCDQEDFTGNENR